MARILVRMTTPPYGTSDAAEGLEFAITATNYGHTVQILFEGQGVLQLLNNQQPIGMLNHGKRLHSLTFFDIEECFVCEESMKTLNISRSDVATFVEFIPEHEIVQLYQKTDHVVTF